MLGFHVDHPPSLFRQFGARLGVRIVHSKVGDNDRHGQRYGQHAAQGTERAHDHAQVRLGDYVAIAHRSHGD